jgi:hypothetical protein
MRQEEGGHAASQRARDPGRRLRQLVPRLPARGRFGSELFALREAVWRAYSVQSGHEHLLGGRDGDQQRREARVQGAAASERGGRAAGVCVAIVSTSCLYAYLCVCLYVSPPPHPPPPPAHPSSIQGTYLGSCHGCTVRSVEYVGELLSCTHCGDGAGTQHMV